MASKLIFTTTITSTEASIILVLKHPSSIRSMKSRILTEFNSWNISISNQSDKLSESWCKNSRELIMGSYLDWPHAKFELCISIKSESLMLLNKEKILQHLANDPISNWADCSMICTTILLLCDKLVKWSIFYGIQWALCSLYSIEYRSN